MIFNNPGRSTALLLRLSALLIILAVLATTLVSCYSLSGVSLDPNIRTYYVHPFKDNAENSPAALSVDLTEALKEKIRTQSRLVYSEENPDIEFRGTIVDYRVSAEAPQPGEITSINRLTLITAIEFVNNRQQDKGWKTNFFFFYDFPSSQDLNSIEQQANQTIIAQIMEDIFNKAFTDW